MCFYNNLRIINEKIAFLTDKNKFVPERVNGQFQISFNFWPTFHYTLVEVTHTVWGPWNIAITFRILTTLFHVFEYTLSLLSLVQSGQTIWIHATCVTPLSVLSCHLLEIYFL